MQQGGGCFKRVLCFFLARATHGVAAMRLTATTVIRGLATQAAAVFMRATQQRSKTVTDLRQDGLCCACVCCLHLLLARSVVVRIQGLGVFRSPGGHWLAPGLSMRCTSAPITQPAIAVMVFSIDARAPLHLL
jgi:hypothetical protein